MSDLTTEDILSTARRAGWPITPQRAAELAATAAPAIKQFHAGRVAIGFDDDTASFAAALEDQADGDPA
jgi:hypothetical protein